MKFEICDIVRFKPEKEIFGLYEITGFHVPSDYECDCTITKDECNSEIYARQDDLMLVCSINDRKDL
jgi:hypothetical protein